MKTHLSKNEFSQAVLACENGGSVTLEVIRCLPDATEEAVDREIERVYDAAEYPEN